MRWSSGRTSGGRRDAEPEEPFSVPLALVGAKLDLWERSLKTDLAAVSGRRFVKHRRIQRRLAVRCP